MIVKCFTCEKQLQCVCVENQPPYDMKCFFRNSFPCCELLKYFGDRMIVHYCSEECKKTIYLEMGLTYTYDKYGLLKFKMVSELDYSKIRKYTIMNISTGEKIIIDRRPVKFRWIILLVMMLCVILLCVVWMLRM